jgi:hypothetical protein
MPRKRLKVKERTLQGVFPYPTPEQRTPEQQLAVEQWLSGRASRPSFTKYPEHDSRDYFGPELLTREEEARIPRWYKDARDNPAHAHPDCNCGECRLGLVYPGYELDQGRNLLA